MHGNFDGGAAASLSDFWEAMMKHRAPAGGFLWALLDEGLVRNDHHDSIDCRGSLAPDGIVGPYREKEASFYAIRDIWSPVKIASRKASDRLAVENHFMFTDLAQCRFTYRLTDLSMRPDGHFEEKTAYEGTAAAPSTKPGECRIIDLGLPSDWHKHDVLHLDVAGPDGRSIYTFSAPIDNAGGTRLYTPRRMHIHLRQGHSHARRGTNGKRHHIALRRPGCSHIGQHAQGA